MIYKATAHDLDSLASLAVMLWPTHTLKDIRHEFAEIIPDENAAFFICSKDGQAMGFAQWQLRYDYVEGTKSRPVG